MELGQSTSIEHRVAGLFATEPDQVRERLRVDVQAGFDQQARGESRAYDNTSGRRLAEQVTSRGRAL